MKKALHGISFSPAGLLTPFHFGASTRLQELGLLTSTTTLAGASGGAIASVMSALFAHYEENNLSIKSLLLQQKQKHSSNENITNTFIPNSKLTFIDYLQSIPSLKSSFEDNSSISEASSKQKEDKELLKYLSLYGSVYIALQCRDHGARGTLRYALDEVLDCMLPSNIHEILNQRDGHCLVSYLEMQKREEVLTSSGNNPQTSSSLARKVKTWVSNRYHMQPQHIHNYSNKEDVMEVIRASCNIPFYFNGNNVFVKVRNQYAVDGAMAGHINRFYCPVTHAHQSELLILPFHASKLNISAERLMKRQQAQHPHKPPCQIHLISVDDIQQKDKWPFSIVEMIRMIIAPPFASSNPFQKISNEELLAVYETLFHAGEHAVDQWYQRIDGKLV